MRLFGVRRAIPFILFAAALLTASLAQAEGDPHKTKHIDSFPPPGSGG